MLKAISWTLPDSLELCSDLSVPVVGPPGAPMPICACSLHVTCFQHLFHCKTRPGAVLLAFARRGLFVLGLVRLSETLRIILHGFQLPQCLAAYVRYTCYVSEAF